MPFGTLVSAVLSAGMGFPAQAIKDLGLEVERSSKLPGLGAMRFTTRSRAEPVGVRLHLGHAHSAILAHDAARSAGGVFLLRIEDIDRTRCRPEFRRTPARRSRLAWTRFGPCPCAGSLIISTTTP